MTTPMEKDELEKTGEKLVEYVKKNDPTKAAEMQAFLDERHAKQEQFKRSLARDYINKKIVSIFLILLFIAACGIIIFLFTQSIFEGFIALLAFVFLLAFLVRK